MILIVGDTGYVGQNLKFYLNDFDVYNRSHNLDALSAKINASTTIIHLAALQRCADETLFDQNFELTKFIVDQVRMHDGKKLIFASSISVTTKNNKFSITKLKEEDYIKKNLGSNKYTICRIPNTYGPFGKPNYNNFFPTFSYSVWNNKPLTIDNPNLYIDLLSIRVVIENILSQFNVSENKTIEFSNLERFRIVDVLKNMCDEREFGESIMPSDMRSSFYYYKNNF